MAGANREHREHYEQVALFQWAALMQGRYPELGLLHAIPNAARRSPRQGAWMKAEGLRAGVPDVHLPVARGGCIGLWIELKAGKNRPTGPQLEWLSALREAGHRVAVCYSCAEAVREIEGYLGISKEGEK
jgi:hypothetical protein